MNVRRVTMESSGGGRIAPGKLEVGSQKSEVGSQTWSATPVSTSDFWLQTSNFSHPSPGQPSTLLAARMPFTIASATTSAASDPRTVRLTSGRVSDPAETANN